MAAASVPSGASTGAAARLLLALAAIVLAYVVGSQTLATALRGTAPEQAYRLAPWDADVLAKRARGLIPANVDRARLAEADALARRALRRDGLSLDALVTLGMDAQVRGEAAAARTYMRLAETLSRRDLQVHVWAIEDAVARNDIPAAMRHYDLALRTSRDARELMFPVLAAAIADPALAQAALRVMAARPYWAPDFLYHIATKGPDARAAARLITAAALVGVPVTDAVQASMVDSLIAQGHLDAAWSAYVAANPGASRTASRDPQFANDRGSRSAFDWQLLGGPELSASVERGERVNLLAFSIAPGASGPIARQMQLLPPGPYVLLGRSGGIDLPDGSRPVWELSCRDGRSLGQVALPAAGDAAVPFAARFDVPADCPAQYLSLLARSGAAAALAEGTVEDVRLSVAAAR